MPAEPIEHLKAAVSRSEAGLIRELLARHPDLKARINEPVGSFDSPLIVHARTPEVLDALLEAGADVNARSQWWAGGFGLLDGCPPELADVAIQRGAILDVHSAARLGRLEALRELIARQPEGVHARGGDGQTPLHFAGTVEIAEFLLDHGADMDARDIDHESTPAQYMVRDRQEIARHLIRRGCQTDILMAAAIGDTALVRRHLDANPDCIRMRVTNEFFPMINRRSGGTIYQWTLGWYVSAHDVARDFGRSEILQLLLERSPSDVKLLDACWAGDAASAAAMVRDDPGIAAKLSPADRRHLAMAARNNNTAAVHAMLAAGLPVDATGQHGATPLHWAAFHGNLDMIRDLLGHRPRPPLEVTDVDFNTTPLGWAIYGSEHGWYCRTGDYAGTVQALLDAGANPGDPKLSGSQAVQEVLRRHRTS